MNFYNENDPRAAAWLRELISGGHIAPGVVDERSIADIRPEDLDGFVQCHFFAGIGGWSLALRLAGWPDDRPVWTGSCPCQPFSAAGKRKGTEDERHLWPIFRELIRGCQPATVFGEQVASADGREWLSGVFAELEAMAYQRAGADLCAAGVGAPHIRQRLWWVAHAELPSCKRFGQHSGEGLSIEASDGFMQGGSDGRMGNTERERVRVSERGSHECSSGGVQVKDGQREWIRANAWSASGLVHCADGKSRRVESGTFPLAHGIPGRVGLLRGYGNAIVPQVAAEFIISAEEARLATLGIA